MREGQSREDMREDETAAEAVAEHGKKRQKKRTPVSLSNFPVLCPLCDKIIFKFNIYHHLLDGYDNVPDNMSKALTYIWDLLHKNGRKELTEEDFSFILDQLEQVKVAFPEENGVHLCHSLLEVARESAASVNMVTKR